MIICEHLFIGEDRKDVYLLGYRLHLTPFEFKILSALADGKPKTANELASSIGRADDKKGNVAVHICAVNRKAFSISERKLVLFEDSKYFLNENM